MTLTMSAAAVRAETLVGASTPQGETGWCLAWCVRAVYNDNGPYRWGGNGKAWAINYWLAAKKWGRVVQTSDPTNLPAGAMAFFGPKINAGARPRHVAIADGKGKFIGTDYPRARKIGRGSLAEIARWLGFGTGLLGYIQVTGDGIDLRDSGPVDPMNPANYYVGAHGDHVLWLGQRLVEHGITRYTPTKDFTKSDVRAVSLFQKAQGWSGPAADGLPGAETLRRLKADPQPSPAQFLGLGDDWKVTLPIGRKNHPTEIQQPALATYSHPDYFHLNDEGDGVVFATPAKGVTTKGSTYTRTEARELRNGKLASWDTRHGTSTLWLKASVGELPPGAGGVVLGQIHDADDDRTMIRAINYKGRVRLIAEFGYGKGKGGEPVTIGDVSRHTEFTVQMHASAGVVVVSLNGTNVTKRVVHGDGMYFKFGDYLISHTGAGEVTIHAVKRSYS